MMLLDIDLATAVLFDKVQKGKGEQISEPALKMLRKRKLVEGRKSHLYISKMVAKATNQEVKYTLTKGAMMRSAVSGLLKPLKIMVF